MYTKLKKINEGFTIVEVLIVLAIAALILTIILIAVPDLQRSSRNTDIYHDAQNLAAAVQSYEGNNSGGLPTTVSPPAAGVVTISGGSNTASATAHVQQTDTIIPLSAYAGNLTYGQIGAPVIGTIDVDINATCPTSSAHTVTLTGGNNRAVAVLYPIEGSTSAASSIGCIQE